MTFPRSVAALVVAGLLSGSVLIAMGSSATAQTPTPTATATTTATATATPTATATATAAPSAAVTAVVTALQSAMDRGDLATAMALVTEGISVEGIGLCAASPCVGKNAVLPEFQRRISANIQRVRLNVQVVGNTVTTNFEIRDDNTRRCNVERILLSEANDVLGSLVAAQRVRLDLADAQTAALRACQLAAAAAQVATPAPPKTGNAGLRSDSGMLSLVALLFGAVLLPVATRRATRR